MRNLIGQPAVCNWLCNVVMRNLILQPAVCNWLCNVVIGNLIVQPTICIWFRSVVMGNLIMQPAMCCWMCNVVMGNLIVQPAMCCWLCNVVMGNLIMLPAMCNVVMGNLIVCQQCAIGCAMLSWGIDSAASSVQLVMQCCHGEFDSADFPNLIVQISPIAVCCWLSNVVMGNLIVCQQCAIGCAMLSWGIDSADSSVQLVVQCCHGEFVSADSSVQLVVQCCHGEFDSAAINVLLVVQCCHGEFDMAASNVLCCQGEFNSMQTMCHWLCNVVMGNGNLIV